MGASDPAEEPATIAMQLSAPLSKVCDVLDAPRSTIYARQDRSRGDNVIALRPATRSATSATSSWSPGSARCSLCGLLPHMTAP
jgi:hypothetical protein